MYYEMRGPPDCLADKNPYNTNFRFDDEYYKHKIISVTTKAAGLESIDGILDQRRYRSIGENNTTRIPISASSKNEYRSVDEERLYYNKGAGASRSNSPLTASNMIELNNVPVQINYLKSVLSSIKSKQNIPHNNPVGVAKKQNYMQEQTPI